MLREYDDKKEKEKNQKSMKDYKVTVKQCYFIVWRVEKIKI